MWARKPTAVTLQVPALDRFRLCWWMPWVKTTTITPENGTYTIDLPGMRCYAECYMGGPPFFLVEEGCNSRTCGGRPAFFPHANGCGDGDGNGNGRSSHSDASRQQMTATATHPQHRHTASATETATASATLQPTETRYSDPYSHSGRYRGGTSGG